MAATERALEKAQDESSRYSKALARVKDEGKKAMQAGIRTGAGMGTAFAVGYVEGRYPEKATVFGIDLSLLVGVAGTAVGAFGLTGDQQTNELIEAAGNGALFAFAAKKGSEIGKEKAAA